ncbi:MAG TPA: hypothetical protein PK228_05435 [Saprospiraceae bacterium]|nr:hypothetical protein [Saprospiraceae bacterium]
MPTDQERYEQIERYLAGEMPETERQAFEAALQDDPALAETLALHRAMRESLGNRQRRHLFDALADVVEQEEHKRSTLTLKRFSSFRLAAAAAVLVLVAAVGVWTYFQPQVEPPVVAEQPASPPPIAPDTAQTTTPPAPAEKPAAPGRLALTDRRAFAPNPALDPLAGTLVRGGSADVSVTQPENDAILPLLNGQINFRLEGKSGDDTALTLFIYNNLEADFAAGKAVYHTDIPIRDHVFTLETRITMPPGRYYAVLSAPGEEEPLAVLRFFAGSRK